MFLFNLGTTATTATIYWILSSTNHLDAVTFVVQFFDIYNLKFSFLVLDLNICGGKEHKALLCG